jgi:hypothetical protein
MYLVPQEINLIHTGGERWEAIQLYVHEHNIASDSPTDPTSHITEIRTGNISHASQLHLCHSVLLPSY